jgi:hypothetical protein
MSGLASASSAGATTASGEVIAGRLSATAPSLVQSDPAGLVRATSASQDFFVAQPGAATRFIGRVYGQYGPNTWYVCSGTVVNSPNSSIVWTAAHCVLSPDFHHRPPEAIYFVPGLQPSTVGNPQPYGLWRAVAWAVPKAFARYGDPRAANRDYAALLIARNAQGLTIGQALGGGERISFAYSAPRRVVALGYPAADKFSGNQSLIGCGPARVGRRFGMLRIACGATAGASGGPWLAGVGAGGVGTVVSVFDLYNPHHPIWWGSPLGRVARATWAKLASLAVP